MGAAAGRPGQQPLLDAAHMAAHIAADIAAHVDAVLDWYRGNGRDLPWRAPDRTPWGVLVCEVMSQQTPVARIVGPWQQWLARWPTPADLAAASPGEAIRMWGRLGYPRRALRLHAAATAMVERHDGHVPASVADLLALPGVGAYTAAATAAFAFGVRTTVLDVNIRRVLGRLVDGAGAAPTGSPSRAETALATALLPPDPPRAATWNAALMELGALVCVARAPRCPQCPLAVTCRTAAAATAGVAGAGGCDGVRASSVRPGGTPQPWVGTDRYVRGLIMAVLRESEHGVARGDIDLVWTDGGQVGRCLDGLVADGLAVENRGVIELPGKVVARQA